MTQAATPTLALCKSGVKVKDAQLENISTRELFKYIKDVKTGTKDGSYFLRARVIDTSKGRNDNNTAGLSSVVILDADSTVDIQTGVIIEGAPCPHAVHETLKQAGVNHLIYSSYSHGIKGNRYRILLSTDTTYNRKQLPPTVSHALGLCGGVVADVKENLTWSQPWYIPRKPTDTSDVILLAYKAGKPLPVQQPQQQAPPAPQPDFASYKPQNTTIAGLNPITAYNDTHAIEKELQARGDIQHGNKWLYHASTSKEAGISVQDNKMYSHHGSDPLNDGKPHDCFDVMQDRLGLSFNDAIKHAVQRTKAPKKTATKKTKQKKEKADKKSPVENLKPYSAPVSGGELLDEMATLLNKHVYLPPGMDTALACWCLGSYCFSSWQLYPKLLITSPEKRCGKTTLLEVIEGLAFRCYPVSNISTSSMFRLIEEYKPTLLIDEADTFLKDNIELNGIINAGHKKRLANVPRTERDGNEFHVRNFSVWSPMVLAGIGAQRDTLHDRSIHIEIERKLPDHTVKKIPFYFFETTAALRSKCIRWAQDNKKKLKELAVTPNHGNDRAQDNWQPLVTIASLSSNEWQEKVLKVYREVMLHNAPEENAGIMLLRDIQNIFVQRNTSRMFTAELVDRLTQVEESPWQTWRCGQPMTQMSLSRLLKPFKIQSKNLRLNNKVARGFDLKQFENTFIRYIPPIQGATTLQASCGAGSSRFQGATNKTGVAPQKPLKRSCDAECSIVAPCNGGIEGKAQKPPVLDKNQPAIKQPETPEKTEGYTL